MPEPVSAPVAPAPVPVAGDPDEDVAEADAQPQGHTSPSWRERALVAEAKLAAIGEVCDRPFLGTSAEARWAADILAIIGDEEDGDGR